MGDIGSVADAAGKLIDEDLAIQEREKQQEDALDKAVKDLKQPLPPPTEKGKT
jgi:hypothetical protein